ncbi:MAG: peptide deformylase [Candidatus Spechtbacterales bacterium]
MVQPVVQDPDPVLHNVTEPVKNFNDPELAKLLKDMKDTLAEQEGLGLAALQIGVSKSIFVIPPEHAPEVRTPYAPLSYLKPLKPTVFMNPKILRYSEEKETLEEGCLSIRGLFRPTPRSYAVTLQAQDERGRKFKIKADQLLARIFQHETDHLNGVLFIERIVQ